MSDNTPDWQDLAITAMARSAELTEHRDEAMDSRNALADINRDLCGLLTQAKQRIAELEAERDRLAQERDMAMRLGADNLAAARERIAALEHERDQWRSAHNGQKAQVAMLEAERDAALKVVDENWVTHQQVIESRERERRLKEALLAANAYFGACSDPVAIKVRAALAAATRTPDLP